MGNAKETLLTVFTIGHSTRTLPEFVELLRTFGVAMVVDVRSVPRSRHNPQFNKETFSSSLKSEGIGYIHMPDIGGLRRPSPDSVNTAWRNKSFRGYADFMQTREFVGQLLRLMILARKTCITIMCAEALPWRCHRSLIADALVVRNVKVQHIVNKSSLIMHQLTEFAHFDGTRITYPLYTKPSPQTILGDFGSSR